jgi:hypothetical protein
MSEDAKPVRHAGNMKMGNEVIALSETPVNIIYFEEAPSLSHVNGVIGVTLAVTHNIPDQTSNTVRLCISIAAVLKCNVQAAMALRAALDSALLLAHPIQNTGKPS